MEEKTIVINLISGPGSGKSTLAAELFVTMKKLGLSVEYLQEYAKYLVWQQDFDMLNNQHIVSLKYCRSIRCMKGKVKYIILDSSLLAGIYYNEHNPDNLSDKDKTKALILKYFNEFDNMTFFCNRGDYIYETLGRLQTKDEALVIDRQMKQMLIDLNIQHHDINIADGITMQILDILGLMHNQACLATC